LRGRYPAGSRVVSDKLRDIVDAAIEERHVVKRIVNGRFGDAQDIMRKRT
jgi:hypothetical protein